MTRVGILGANGRMGRVLIEAAAQDNQIELSAAAVRPDSGWIGMDVGEMAGIGQMGMSLIGGLTAAADKLDVVIDFTLPDALAANLEWCVTNGIPMVIGTTGLNSEQMARMDQAASQIPIVFAANYSVGVNLMLKLVADAARVMADSADIEVLETHHRFKQDAPSGTALAIGDAIAQATGRDLSQCAVYQRHGHTGEREQQQIGFATLRAGDVVGDHTALFADLGERLEITHKASSRLTFAKGAMSAAKWLKGQAPGRYSMQDVLGFN